MIENLERFLEEESGDKKVLILTGTFDPSHSGHVHCVESGLRAHENSLACVLANTWNPFKDLSGLDWNRRWETISITFSEFLDEKFQKKVHLVGDMEIINSRAKFEGLIGRFKGRIIRLMGNDRGDLLESSDKLGVSTIVTDRSEVPISSTLIRAGLEQGDTSQFEHFVSKRVLEAYRNPRKA